MSQQPYTAPKFGIKAFHCPFCNAYARQNWSSISVNHTTLNNSDICMTFCSNCSSRQVWLSEKMIYPVSSPAPMPNTDMPQDVMEDYNEARAIVTSSPRGATAILRLALQKLCKDLGEEGKKINDDIASLVKKGLHPKVQKALDIVRVIGNESVHPGQIDMKDNIEIATALFHLLNRIVEDMITSENEINELYNMLPEDKRKGIEERDKK